MTIALTIQMTSKIKSLTGVSARCAGESRGAATVELAICLPIIVVLLLATTEACVMLQLKQNLTVIAYEGARVGILPGATAQNVQTQCDLLITDRSIGGSSVQINPDPRVLNVGDLLTVTVSADCVANSAFGGYLYQGKTMTESVVMQAE